MAKSEFQLMRELATKYGVAAPESGEGLYSYRVVSNIVRAAKKYGQEVGASRIEELESAVRQTIDWIESTNAIQPEDRGGRYALRSLHDVLATKQ